MNRYILCKAKSIETGVVGIIVNVNKNDKSFCVEFPFGYKWLKEYEIIIGD